jgi:hypothetical protein
LTAATPSSPIWLSSNFKVLRLEKLDLDRTEAPKSLIPIDFKLKTFKLGKIALDNSLDSASPIWL